jgi:hypothetical protein
MRMNDCLCTASRKPTKNLNIDYETHSNLWSYSAHDSRLQRG